MATDWGGSGDKDKSGGNNGNGSGSIPCPIVVAGIVGLFILSVKLVRK